MTALLPEEIILSIIKAGSFEEFTADTAIIHKDIYKLKKNPQFKEVLKPFKFTGSPAAPFSRILESALFNLHFTNMLRRFNLDLIVYTVSEKGEERYQNDISPKLDSPSLELFRGMAEKFRELKHAH